MKRRYIIQDARKSAKFNYNISVENFVDKERVKEFLPDTWRKYREFNFWGRPRKGDASKNDVIIFIVDENVVTVANVLEDPVKSSDLARAIGWRNAEKFPYVFPIEVILKDVVIDSTLFSKIMDYKRSRFSYWLIPAEIGEMILKRPGEKPTISIDDSWVPPIFMDLLYKDIGWEEFENRTVHILKILGFDVIQLGAGRKYEKVPDAILKLNIEKGKVYIVADVKYRDNYKFSANERRAMIDYIYNVTKQHTDFKEIYLMVIAKSFSKERLLVDITEIHERAPRGFKDIILLNIEQLISYLYEKLKNPEKYNHEYLYKKLLINRIVIKY